MTSPPLLRSRGAGTTAWARTPARVRTSAGLLVFAAASFVLCRLGLALAPGPASLALFWPAAGLGFGALLVSDVRRWPALLIAAGLPIAAFNALAGQPPLLVCAFAFTNALEASLAAWLVLRLCGGRPRLVHPGQVLAVVLAGPLATSGLCAFLSAAVLWGLFGQPLGFLWLHLWAGAGLGMIAVGTLVLAWAEPRAGRGGGASRWILEPIAVLGASLFLAWLVFLGPTSGPVSYEFLLLPPLVWAALRYGLRGATAVGLLLIVLALAATVAGRGFAVSATRTSVEAQVFCFVVTLTALFLASAVEAGQRSAEALRLGEEKYRLLVENQTDLVLKMDVGGRLLFVSPSYCRMCGKGEAELLGKSFLLLIPEEDRESVVRTLEGLRRPPHTAHLERRALTAHGCRWLAWAFTAVLDATGSEMKVVGVGRDVTEQRHVEERLRQSEKLEAIGRVAGGLAHDFNNQLAAILSSAEYLSEVLTSDPEVRNSVDTIREAAQRSAGLTRQLLSFGRRRQPPRSVTIDLHHVVQDVEALLVRSIDKRIALSTRGTGAPALTTGDPDRLGAAVLNLALNARDAMPAGGTLTLAVRELELGPDRGAALGVAPGPYVELSVADTGVGLSAEARERLFEPFFTTKAVGQGTGLGLPEVYGTVKAHAGAVEVDSAPGRGTTVALLLPRADGVVASVEPAPAEASTAVAPSPSLRVLVVDDEASVRRSLALLLRRAGHAVTECDGGREAVRSCASARGALDLAIIDMMMPEITGREVFAELRAVTPELPVIISSGFSPGEDVEVLRSEPGVFLLAKPYTSEQLKRTILSAVV